MLTTHLNNVPYSKFVLIEDSLEQVGESILKCVIRTHLKNSDCKIYYFVCEGSFETAKKSFVHPNVEYYDFVSDSQGWLGSSKNNFSNTVAQIDTISSLIVIDSLSHLICQYNYIAIYRIFQWLLNKDILRIVTVLHQDMLDNPNKISRYFQNLSTLSLTLEPKVNSKSGRVSYTFKKVNGKIIRQTEEYKVENGILIAEKIKKIDPKILIQQNINQIMPENLSTFKISLGDKDKESRSKLVLPYLPKDDKLDGDNTKEGTIHYQFDNIDDWDEEDPDDDLDI